MSGIGPLIREIDVKYFRNVTKEKYFGSVISILLLSVNSMYEEYKNVYYTNLIMNIKLTSLLLGRCQFP